MHVTQGLKFVQAIAPVAIDGATATAIAVDTLGFDELALILSQGVMDDALTALKVTECETSGGSYTDVDGADFATDATLPDAGDDGKINGVFINLQNRKRFIKVVATSGSTGAGVVLSILALLARAEQQPSDASSRGLDQELIVVS